MYAQCPECLTFFHLKPSHLKAANGRVRCSRCKAVFNALETLRDELTPAEIAAVEAARRREPKSDVPFLNEEYAGDLFDGLEYTKNAELGLDAPEPAFDDRRDEEEAAKLAAAAGPQARLVDRIRTPVRQFPDFGAPRRKRRSLLWGIGILFLLLVLLAQFVHWQRDTFLQHAVAGPWLERIYSEAGFDLSPPPDLAALKVSRTEVSSHPDHPRALHLTALLENRSENTQTWPDLRVDLQDRWGDTVGARFFAPGEYLRDAAASAHPMSARGRYPVSLSIMDPGSNAVGFQIEPCLAGGSEEAPRHLCASDMNAK